MDQDYSTNGQYGVIHEVGDMGLGFTHLPSHNDQKTLRNYERHQNEKKRQQNNW